MAGNGKRVEVDESALPKAFAEQLAWAERFALGAILLAEDRAAAKKALALLGPECFWTGKYRAVFVLLQCAMIEQVDPVLGPDLLRVRESWAQRQPALGGVTMDHVAEIVDQVSPHAPVLRAAIPELWRFMLRRDGILKVRGLVAALADSSVEALRVFEAEREWWTQWQTALQATQSGKKPKLPGTPLTVGVVA